MIYVLRYVYLDFTTKQKVNLAQARAGVFVLVSKYNTIKFLSSLGSSVAWHKKA